MANQKEQLSMKDRLDKARLKQQVRQEEVDIIDDLTSLVPDNMVRLVPSDEDSIAKQVEEIEAFFFVKYNLQFKKKTKNNDWRKPNIANVYDIARLTKLLWLGYSVTEACQECWMHEMSFYRFLDKNPEFRDSFKQVKEKYLAYLSRRNLATLLIEWDKDATFRWLEANDPKYSRKPVNVGTVNNNNLVLEITPDRAVQILESLKKKRKILEEWEYGTITRTRPDPNS